MVTPELGSPLVISGVGGGTGAVLLQCKGMGEGAESTEEVAEPVRGYFSAPYIQRSKRERIVHEA